MSIKTEILSQELARCSNACERLNERCRQQAEQIASMRQEADAILDDLIKAAAENKRLKELLDEALSIVMFPYREPLDEYSDAEQYTIQQKWIVKSNQALAATPQNG